MFPLNVADFADLFPERNTLMGPFTVITLAQHTENDMTMWSTEVETEREALFETVSVCCYCTDYLHNRTGDSCIV